MIIDEIVYQCLVNSNDLYNHVQDRIFAIELPEQTQIPAIRFEQVSGLPENNSSGSTFDKDNRYQVDVYSDRLNEAKIIQELVFKSLTGEQKTQVLILNSLSTRNENGLYIATTDYRIYKVN